MLRVHLPKPDKHRAKEALLSLKDLSVQISLPFQLRSPSSPFPLGFQETLPLTSTVGEAHESGQDFYPPLTSLSLTTHGTDSKQDAPAAVTDSGSISSRRRQRRCARAPGTGNPRQPSSIRKRHTLHSLLRRFLLKSSHLSLASTFATSNLFPRGTFCFIITTCSHFLNCPGFFMQLGEKNPPPFPFRFLFLYLELSAKNSPWEHRLYCCCIFLSCHFIPNKMQVPPRATCSHLRPALPSIFNYHFTYLLWLYAESLTLENTLHIALLSLRCWLDWLLSWPWGQDSTQRP